MEVVFVTVVYWHEHRHITDHVLTVCDFRFATVTKDSGSLHYTRPSRTGPRRGYRRGPSVSVREGAVANAGLEVQLVLIGQGGPVRLEGRVGVAVRFAVGEERVDFREGSELHCQAFRVVWCGGHRSAVTTASCVILYRVPSRLERDW